MSSMNHKKKSRFSPKTGSGHRVTWEEYGKEEARLAQVDLLREHYQSLKTSSNSQETLAKETQEEEHGQDILK